MASQNAGNIIQLAQVQAGEQETIATGLTATVGLTSVMMTSIQTLISVERESQINQINTQRDVAVNKIVNVLLQQNRDEILKSIRSNMAEKFSVVDGSLLNRKFESLLSITMVKALAEQLNIDSEQLFIDCAASLSPIPQNPPEDEKSS